MLLTGTIIQGLFYMKCRKVGVSQWADCGKVEQWLCELSRAVSHSLRCPPLVLRGDVKNECGS